MQIGEYEKTIVVPKRYVNPIIIPTTTPKREEVSVPLTPKKKEKVNAG